MTNNREHKPKAVIVYHLQFRDGSVDLPLSFVHRSYLCFIAERGGQVQMDYGPLSEEQRVHIRAMIHPLRVIEEHASIGDRATLVIHRLTDVGRNIVGEILKAGGP